MYFKLRKNYSIRWQRHKVFYENLNKRHLTLTFKQKWYDDLTIELKDNIWRQLFRICFKTIQDPYFKWFQYRLMHGILGTQKNSS